MREGWEEKTLGKVCMNLDSMRVPIAKSKRESGDIPYYGASGIVDHVADYIFNEDLLLVSEDGANLLARTYPIAFSISGKTWVNNHAHVLRFSEITSQKFIEYYLNSISLDPYVSGMAQPKLNQKSLNSIAVPFPTIREQKRIVAILDEAFAGIATAVVNTEKNLANARELFESYLNSKLIRNDASWRRCRLGSIVERLTNGYVGPTRNIYIEAGIPYLLARHVKDNCLAFDGKTFISDEFNQKNKKSTLKAGDVLLVQSGHIGHSAVVPKSHEGHNCHAMIVITPVADRLAGNFLSLFFNSPEMRKRFTEIRSGSTVPHLTCRAVKELKVPVPDLSTQQKLVNDVQELQTETRQLESLYQHKLVNLAELKQSLLHKAFSGALTSQSVSVLQEAVA